MMSEFVLTKLFTINIIMNEKINQFIGEYYMTVVRFDIPNTQPIFKFEEYLLCYFIFQQ